MVTSELWDNAINTSDYDYKKEMESTSIGQITVEQAAVEILAGVSRNRAGAVVGGRGRGRLPA